MVKEDGRITEDDMNLYNWRNVAIVGHAADKFTDETEEEARRVIRLILSGERVRLVSGGCHMGGVDIFAEEEADEMGLEKSIFRPEALTWGTHNGKRGFRDRNLMIAERCSEAHCVVVKELPPGYRGMKFNHCYHCFDVRPKHIKSGGCWTVVRAGRQDKPTFWHIIGDEDE